MPECRVCLVSCGEDQLLSPCHCRGSVKFIHQDCLDQWLRQKYKHQFQWLLKNFRGRATGFRCELCQFEYVGSVKLLGPRAILLRVLQSQASLSILLNLLVMAYLTFKIKNVRRNLGQSLAAIVAQWRVYKDVRKLRILPCLVQLGMMLLASSVYIGSLPIMALSTWQLTESVLADCFKLQIQSVVS